jgi:aconitase B
MSTDLQGWQLKTLVVLPLARRIDQHAATSLKLGLRIFEKLQEVEDSVEIIAREMARQAK